VKEQENARQENGDEILMSYFPVWHFPVGTGETGKCQTEKWRRKLDVLFSCLTFSCWNGEAGKCQTGKWRQNIDVLFSCLIFSCWNREAV
jgi:hypothetical protein